ncbi:MAG: hypothetical protein LQ350_004868 [Teloschistes chrysophthalmus]|nr:MAG: hypothetical protein LQ350_004868 [Niorma chrysophthalma]
MTDITAVIKSLIDFTIEHPKTIRIRIYDGSAPLPAPLPPVLATESPQARALRYQRPPTWEKPRLTNHLHLPRPERPLGNQYAYTLRETIHQFSLPDTYQNSTLNADPTGTDLAFVLISKDQHYAWPTERWIHCKSNLHLLAPPSASAPLPHPVIPQDITYEPLIPTHPFALFTQDDLSASCLEYPESEKKFFQFKGWWVISQVLYVREGSPFVEAMMDNMFDALGKERTTEEWNAGVMTRWGCVESKPWDGGDEGGLGTPLVPLKYPNPMVPLKYPMQKLSEEERVFEEEVARLMMVDPGQRRPRTSCECEVCSSKEDE